MKKNILIPTDFSENAWNAIVYTLNLYKETPCNIYFLNTYNFPGYLYESEFVTNPSAEVYQEYKLFSENKLKETIETVEFRFKNDLHDFFSITKHSSLYDGIIDFLDEKFIDLIVMGAKGEGNNTDVIYGSNTIEIIENIPECPVLAIPEIAKQKIPNEIVLLTDYKTIDSLLRLNVIVDIAHKHKSNICVLHINDKKELTENQIFNKKKLEAYLSPVSFFNKSLSNNDLFEALNCFTQSRESDMVCFFSKKKNMLQNIFNKPLVKKIGQHSKIPILVMH